MGYAYARISLEEVDERELIEELDGRYLSVLEQERLLAMIKDCNLYQESQKFGVFLKHKDRYSPSEIEELLKEKTGEIKISEDQIKIPFE